MQNVDWTNGGTSTPRTCRRCYAAIQAADAVTDRPSFIVLRTIIAWPAPDAQNTGKAHGSALGDDEVAATKKVLGFDPDQTFEVPPGVLEHTRELVERGKAAQAAWDEEFDAWATKPSADVALYDRLQTRTLPDGWADALPTFDADEKGMATRKASGTVINAIAPQLPELWGGSADLAESNNTTIEGAPSFLPSDRATKMWQADPYAGRVLHFGIREHGMGAIMNGIAAARRHPRLRRHLPHLLRLHAAARCGSPRSWGCRSPTSGPTTRSASARTARPTSRSSTSRPCAPSPGSTSSARPTPTRSPPAGGRSSSTPTGRPG